MSDTQTTTPRAPTSLLKSLHRRLKVKAAREDRNIQDLLDLAVAEYLASKGTPEAA